MKTADRTDAKTETDSYALGLTVLLCCFLEGLALLILYSFTKSAAASLFYSVACLGPLSIWLGPPIYRYIVRASRT